MWVLYRESLSLKYCSSSIFSIAFLVNWFLIKLALTIPIVVIYKSGGLWQKLDTVIEQPDIKFRHDLFLIMEFDHQNYFWTNQPDLKLDADFLKIPSIDVGLPFVFNYLLLTHSLILTNVFVLTLHLLSISFHLLSNSPLTIRLPEHRIRSQRWQFERWTKIRLEHTREQWKSTQIAAMHYGVRLQS